ncbi:hypothetical protein AB0O57_29205 [Streptomyces sp. NPDC091201]|uniref:hypothetical protein n=1 Tax=Streptomyces sp. NPDC091201 TaxID=3155190 RepID=UPI0034409C1F
MTDMEIVLTIRNPTPEAWQDVQTLLAKHAPSVQLDAEWTLERAHRYYAALRNSPRAQEILHQAATRGGFVSADVLRANAEKGLRGHAGPLKSALELGVRKGWWPQAMEAPISSVGPGFGKVEGYRMPESLVPLFLAAIDAPQEN